MISKEKKTATKEKIVICMLKRGKSTLEEIAAWIKLDDFD